MRLVLMAALCYLEQRIVHGDGQAQVHPEMMEMALSSADFGSESPVLIRFFTRPEFSPEGVSFVYAMGGKNRNGGSVEYFHSGADEGGKFQIRRAEKWGLLEGIMNRTDAVHKSAKGACPEGSDLSLYDKEFYPCPAHDPDCGCHGPMVQPGMIGWAQGAGQGPHFFIYVGETPMPDWAHDHTIWGEVQDQADLNTLKQILTFPTKQGQNNTAWLQSNIDFTIRQVTGRD